MNLFSFTEVDVTDNDAMRDFRDQNALVHETIYNTLLGVYQINIEHYPLWSTDIAEDDKDFLLVHDKEHKAISDAINGGTPPNLDEVDFTNQAQTDDWMNDHYLMHQQIEQVLGL